MTSIPDSLAFEMLFNEGSRRIVTERVEPGEVTRAFLESWLSELVQRAGQWPVAATGIKRIWVVREDNTRSQRRSNLASKVVG